MRKFPEVKAETCHWSFGPGRTGPRTKISNRNFGPPDHFNQKKYSYPGNFGPVRARARVRARASFVWERRGCLSLPVEVRRPVYFRGGS